MSAIVFVTFLASLALCVAIGVRLLLVAKQTRQVPEFALGLCMSAGATWPLFMIAAKRMHASGTGASSILFGLAIFIAYAASVGMGLAMWKVFRPNTAWAKRLFYVLCGLLVAFSFVIVFLPEAPLENWTLSGRRMLFFSGRATFQVWAMYECYRNYGMMKRRVKLGLCNPLAANQVLCWAVALSVGLLVTVFETYLNHVVGVAITESPRAMLLATGMALMASMGMWFAFFPPAFHRERILAQGLRAAEAS